MKKYRIAYPYTLRKRPDWLGPVNFLPLCTVCRKPVPLKRRLAPTCSVECEEMKDEND